MEQCPNVLRRGLISMLEVTYEQAGCLMGIVHVKAGAWRLGTQIRCTAGEFCQG